MKKNKKTASRILAAAVSTAFTLNFTPFAVFAEQIDEIETITDSFEPIEEMYSESQTDTGEADYTALFFQNWR